MALKCSRCGSLVNVNWILDRMGLRSSVYRLCDPCAKIVTASIDRDAAAIKANKDRIDADKIIKNRSDA